MLAFRGFKVFSTKAWLFLRVELSVLELGAVFLVIGRLNIVVVTYDADFRWEMAPRRLMTQRLGVRCSNCDAFSPWYFISDRWAPNWHC
jgi:hypothetical protein